MTPQQQRIYDRLRASPDRPVHEDELMGLLGARKPAYITMPRDRLTAVISAIKPALPIAETIARCGKHHYRLFIVQPKEPPHAPPTPFQAA